MQILRTVLAAAASALVATGLVIAPAAVDVADAATSSKPADPTTAQSGTTSVELTPSGQGVLEARRRPLAVPHGHERHGRRVAGRPCGPRHHPPGRGHA